LILLLFIIFTEQSYPKIYSFQGINMRSAHPVNEHWGAKKYSNTIRILGNIGNTDILLVRIRIPLICCQHWFRGSSLRTGLRNVPTNSFGGHHKATPPNLPTPKMDTPGH
jgi:hypothetical protein